MFNGQTSEYERNAWTHAPYQWHVFDMHVSQGDARQEAAAIHASHPQIPSTMPQHYDWSAFGAGHTLSTNTGPHVEQNLGQPSTAGGLPRYIANFDAADDVTSSVHSDAGSMTLNQFQSASFGKQNTLYPIQASTTGTGLFHGLEALPPSHHAHTNVHTGGYDSNIGYSQLYNYFDVQQNLNSSNVPYVASSHHTPAMFGSAGSGAQTTRVHADSAPGLFPDFVPEASNPWDQSGPSAGFGTKTGYIPPANTDHIFHMAGQLDAPFIPGFVGTNQLPWAHGAGASARVSQPSSETRDYANPPPWPNQFQGGTRQEQHVHAPASNAWYGYTMPLRRPQEQSSSLDSGSPEGLAASHTLRHVDHGTKMPCIKTQTNSYSAKNACVRPGNYAPGRSNTRDQQTPAGCQTTPAAANNHVPLERANMEQFLERIEKGHWVGKDCKYLNTRGEACENPPTDKHFVECHILAEAKLWDGARLGERKNWILHTADMASFPITKLKQCPVCNEGFARQDRMVTHLEGRKAKDPDDIHNSKPIRTTTRIKRRKGEPKPQIHKSMCSDLIEWLAKEVAKRQ